MRRSIEVLLTLAGLIAVPSAALLFHFSGMPVQPRHAATARVVAISPHDGRLYANRDYIVVRSPRGTGQFSMRDDEVRCHVGDIVPVDQQGITLTRNARTCR